MLFRSDASNDEMLAAFEEGARTGKIERKGASGKRRIASQILQEMSSIDPASAMASVENWSKFLRDASGRQHHVRFESLEDYIPYRCLDSGFECVAPVSPSIAADCGELSGSGMVL